MKINDNKDAVIINVNTSGVVKLKNDDKKDKLKKDSNVIQANELNLADNPIEKKRKEAQKMAMNLVANAFENDKKIDKDLNDRREHIEQLAKDNEEYQELINDINNQRDKLKEDSSIDQNSEEFKQELMQLDSAQKEYQSKINDNLKSIVEELGIIRGVAIERLKTHEMTDANKQAEDILVAANKEIIGMLMEDVKNNQDEKLEEEKEAAKEKAEKEKAFEERLNAAKNSKDKYNKNNDFDVIYEINNLLDNIVNKVSSSNMEDVKKSLSQVIGELKLTMEDLK